MMAAPVSMAWVTGSSNTTKPIVADVAIPKYEKGCSTLASALSSALIIMKCAAVPNRHNNSIHSQSVPCGGVHAKGAIRLMAIAPTMPVQKKLVSALSVRDAMRVNMA